MFRIFVFMAQGCFKVSVMALLRFWVGVWDLVCRVCFAFTAWGLSCSTCLDIQRVPTQPCGYTMGTWTLRRSGSTECCTPSYESAATVRMHVFGKA